MLHIAAFASGNGTNFGALVDAIAGGDLDARIDVLMCNRPDAYVLQRAAVAGVPSIVLPLEPPVSRARRRAYAEDLVAALRPYRPSLIVLAGWMVILPANFLEGVAAWGARTINLHPALLPPDASPTVVTRDGHIQPAIRGAHALEDALRLYHDRQLSVTGVTVHEVTPQVDVGPIVLQEEVPVYPDDTFATLSERVHTVEHRLLPKAIGRIEREE